MILINLLPNVCLNQREVINIFEPNFAKRLDKKDLKDIWLTNEEEDIIGSFLMDSVTGFKNVNIIQLYKCVSKEHYNEQYPFYNCVLNNVCVFTSSDFKRAKEVYDSFVNLIYSGIEFYEFNPKKML